MATAATTKVRERTFVVLSSAVNITAAAKGRETHRLLRGQIVPESVFAHSNLDKLLSLGAIVENDGEPKVKLTAQAAVNAAGRLEDDVPPQAVDQSATDDETADGEWQDPNRKSEKQEAPSIEHIEAADGFGVQA